MHKLKVWLLSARLTKRLGGLAKKFATFLSILTLFVPFAGALPASADPPVFSEYPLPMEYARSNSITTGSDGALWFSETNPNRIGRMDTAGAVTEYLTPAGQGQPMDITSGPDGALWFTVPWGASGSSYIGRITTSGDMTEYPVPTNSAGPNGIVTGPDGALWFTEYGGDRIGRITTAGDITEYHIPSVSHPEATGITVGADGALWFTEQAHNQIGRITTSGDITEYPLPASFSYPFAITSGSDGALWFTNLYSGQIGRMTTAGTPTVYTVPSDLQASDITSGPDGALWFTGNSALWRITTAGTVTSYVPPAEQPFSYAITNGPDGALWFTEPAANQIGRISLSNTGSAAPTNLTAVPNEDIKSYLTWNAVPGAQYYIIYRNGVKINESFPATFIDVSAHTGDNTYYVTAIGANGSESWPSNTAGVAMADRYHVQGSITINGQSLPTDPHSNSSVQAMDNGGTPRTGTNATGTTTYDMNMTGIFTGQYGVRLQYSYAKSPYENILTNLPDQFLLKEVGTPINSYHTGDITKDMDFTTNRMTVVVKDAHGNPVSTLVSVNNIGDSTITNNVDSGTFTVVGGYENSGGHTDTTGTAGFSLFPNATYQVCAGSICRTAAFTGDSTVVLSPIPGTPANLNAASPAQTPALSWDAVSGATSYNVYRDDAMIGSSATNSFTDTSAAVGDHAYYVTAVNSAGESGSSNSIAVTVVTQAAITSGATASTGMRAPFSFTVTTSGSPTAAISETGALPAGISLTDNGDGTAILSGTAAAGTAGDYPITITADNGVGSPASQSFVLSVTSASSAPGISSSNNDTETYGVPFSFTVNTNGYPAPKLTKTGTLPAGVTFVDNGDGTATLSGTAANSAVGTYNLTFKAKSTAGTVTQSFTLTITKAPIIKKILTTTAHANVAFSKQIIASGFTVPAITETGSLPAGLSFTDNGDGTANIGGTPATGSGGAYSITITATNQLGTSSQTFTLKVNEAPAITSAPSAAATIGSAFTFPVTTTGYPAPVVSKSGVLPPGVTFQGSTDSFVGTPKAGTAGNYPVTITAKNSSGTVTQSFTLTVL